MNGDPYFREHREEHLNQLMTFLRISSISALSDHNEDIRRAATWVVEECYRIGLTRAEIMETEGHPVVYAERIDHPDAPTALIYGHYDVQPVDPLHLWETAPFEPTIRDGRLYARGASDDKGQVFMHLKAIEAILQHDDKLPVNIKLLIEGEEEIGSVNLAPFVRQNEALLKADVIVISDTSLYAPGVPSLTYALRGLTTMELRVKGAKGDLHSGLFGGAAPNAVRALVQMLSSLHHADGTVAVEGFYDQVRPLTPEERHTFAGLGFDEEALKRTLAVTALPGEPGFSALERIWARPTLEFNGIFGGFQGEGSKTVIPAEAGAKISCRLVPDQDPGLIGDAIERHLRANCPPGIRLEITRRKGGGAPAFIAPTEHPALQSAAAALQETYGTKAMFIRGGGSIPVATTLDEVIGAPAVLMGFGLETENFHAPNEHFHLENFDKGLRVLFSYWYKLAAAMTR